jgi:hypothetical protein
MYQRNGTHRGSLSVVGLLFCLLCVAASGAAQSDAGGGAQANPAEAAKQLTDRDPLIRQHGAEELARAAAPEWRHLIEGYRLQEKNTRVRLALDWALYRMGKEESLYAVVRALDTARADQAAGYLASLETPEPLYAILPRVNGNTQARLISVLARAGDAATLEQIKPYTTSFDPKIADAARQAEQEITRRLAAQPDATHTRPRQVGKRPATN